MLWRADDEEGETLLQEQRGTSQANVAQEIGSLPACLPKRSSADYRQKRAKKI